MNSYDQKFQEQVAQRRQMADARQRFLDQMYARMEAEERQRQAEEQQAATAGKKDWFGDAAGGFAAGGWVGAIVGTAKGQLDAYRQRKAEGQGDMEAFGNTVFDTPFGKAGDVASLGGANLGRRLTTGHWNKTDEGVGHALTDADVMNGIAGYNRQKGVNAQNRANTSVARSRTMDDMYGAQRMSGINSQNAEMYGLNAPQPTRRDTAIQQQQLGYSAGPSAAELYQASMSTPGEIGTEQGRTGRYDEEMLGRYGEEMAPQKRRLWGYEGSPQNY